MRFNGSLSMVSLLCPSGPCFFSNSIRIWRILPVALAASLHHQRLNPLHIRGRKPTRTLSRNRSEREGGEERRSKESDHRMGFKGVGKNRRHS
jgi:hypothetical protein